MHLIQIVNQLKVTMTTDIVRLWHERARPEPTAKDAMTQLGCHVEEFGEMLEELEGTDYEAEYALSRVRVRVAILADALKQNKLNIKLKSKEKFLDSLADQIVTAIGVGHCTKMNVVEALNRVNTSNWSKFGVDGYPIKDMHGKISKGPDYKPPVLDGLY